MNSDDIKYANFEKELLESYYNQKYKNKSYFLNEEEKDEYSRYLKKISSSSKNETTYIQAQSALIILDNNGISRDDLIKSLLQSEDCIVKAIERGIYFSEEERLSLLKREFNSCQIKYFITCFISNKISLEELELIINEQKDFSNTCICELLNLEVDLPQSIKNKIYKMAKKYQSLAENIIYMYNYSKLDKDQVKDIKSKLILNQTKATEFLKRLKVNQTSYSERKKCMILIKNQFNTIYDNLLYSFLTRKERVELLQKIALSASFIPKIVKHSKFNNHDVKIIALKIVEEKDVRLGNKLYNSCSDYNKNYYKNVLKILEPLKVIAKLSKL